MPLLRRPQLRSVRRAASLLAIAGICAGCDTQLCTTDVRQIVVTPFQPTVAVGQSITLRATWHGGGCQADAPAEGVMWRVRENVGVVAVELTTGRVSGLARGTAQVDYYESAERSAPTGSVTVTVQ
jgi:uncharacterized protein YjdB